MHGIFLVTIKGSTSTFNGFLVIAHVPGEDHMLLGSFTPQNGSQHTLNCSFTGASNEMESTIGHSNSAKIHFQSITTKWTAPTDKDGMVDFRCVVCLHGNLYSMCIEYVLLCHYIYSNNACYKYNVCSWYIVLCSLSHAL